MNDWNRQVIDEFRANQGKVAQFGDAPLVILHTIGAKSGQLREIPLVALDEDGVLTVFASKAGAPDNPDWYYNLKSTPEITVEYGTDRFSARLDELDPAEASARIGRQAQIMPQFGEYVTKAAPRIIPAFEIVRLG